jgi:hypothetical protein
MRIEGLNLQDVTRRLTDSHTPPNERKLVGGVRLTESQAIHH